jgi:hypothetical protein
MDTKLCTVGILCIRSARFYQADHSVSNTLATSRLMRYFNVYGRQYSVNYSTSVEALHNNVRHSVIIRVLTKSIHCENDLFEIDAQAVNKL